MSHLNAIKIIDYISGILQLMTGFVMITLFFLGAGIFGAVGDMDPRARAILAIIFGTLGLFIGGLAVIFGILSIIAGNAIVNRQVWSQVYHIVVGILNILNFPIGTAIGIYFLWVLLLNPETKDLFSGGSAAAAAAGDPEAFKY